MNIGAINQTAADSDFNSRVRLRDDISADFQLKSLCTDLSKINCRVSDQPITTIKPAAIMEYPIVAAVKCKHIKIRI